MKMRDRSRVGEHDIAIVVLSISKNLNIRKILASKTTTFARLIICSTQHVQHRPPKGNTMVILAHYPDPILFWAPKLAPEPANVNLI